MMQDIVFKVQLFRTKNPKDVKRARSDLLWMLESLVRINQNYLRDYPKTPKLYDSGVIYKPEYGTEEWQDIPTTLERKWGDCEDLAAFRCAELRESGVRCKPLITWRQVDGSYRFHALVMLPSGKREDPSAKLGMYNYREYLKRGPEMDNYDSDNSF